jgi:hypothetical protein
MLQLSAAGVGAGALAIAGSHVPDLINQLADDDVDLSGFDEAFVLDRDTGLYTRSHPKTVGAVERVVDLRGLNRPPSSGLDDHDHHHELETPDWLSESIDRYSRLFEEKPAYEAKIFLGAEPKRSLIPGGTKEGEAWQFGVWPLSVSGGTHYGYVSGCIHRNVNHADFRVTQYGSNVMYVGIHIASWYSNGQQCFGIYESRTGWSHCQCVPKIDFWAMAHSVNAGIQAALPWYLDNLSWAITATAVVLVVAALTAIPAVPPPP